VLKIIFLLVDKNQANHLTGMNAVLDSLKFENA